MTVRYVEKINNKEIMTIIFVYRFFKPFESCSLSQELNLYFFFLNVSQIRELSH